MLLLETLLVKFLPAPEPFRRKDALGWVWEFYIYLFVGSFDNPEGEGELSFQKLNAINIRNFITSSCLISWQRLLISFRVFGKDF